MTTALTGIGFVSPYGAGSYLRFFDTQTDTPKDVYSDADLMTPISNADLVADSVSLFPFIYMDPSLYRIKIYNSANVLKRMVDDYDPGLGAGFGVSSVVGVAQGGTGANNAAAARANIGAASSAALTLAQDSLTELDAKVDSGLNVSDPTRFGLLAQEDEVTLDQLATGFGRVCIQRVRHTTLANTSTNVTTPAFDTSTPLVSEGTEFFTYAFTPLSSSSEVRIHVHLAGDSSGGMVLTLALFSASTCLAGDAGGVTTTGPLFVDFRHEESNAATTPRTYSLRAGVSANTFTANGSTGTLNGKRLSHMTIEEWVTV